jgi:hypothetical protein
MRSANLRCAFVIGIAASIIPAAQADIWRDVVVGMEAAGYQFSGNKNYLGKGWTIDANALYTGQKYNFGFADLTLGSNTNSVPSNFQVSYTTRGIPSANFTWNTGGEALPYTLRVNNGLQDFTTVNGSILVDVSTDINVLGFYDTRVQISNRGDYSTDGFAATDSGSLAFDVGPIDISGNIYADVLAAITQPLWTAAGTENPFAKFSEKAARSTALSSLNDLRNRVNAGEILSDEDMATLVQGTVLSALFDGQQGQGLFQGLLSSKATTMRTMSVIPEPSSALLILGLASALVARRR